MKEFGKFIKDNKEYGKLTENGVVVTKWVIREDLSRNPWEIWKPETVDKRKFKLVDKNGKESNWSVGEDGHLHKEE